MMADSDLLVTPTEFSKLALVKDYIKSRFEVEIQSPDEILDSDLTLIGFDGISGNVKEAINYLKNRVFSGSVVPFPYPQRLDFMFTNEDWQNLVKDFFKVDIVSEVLKVVFIGEDEQIEEVLSALRSLVCNVNAGIVGLEENLLHELLMKEMNVYLETLSPVCVNNDVFESMSSAAAAALSVSSSHSDADDNDESVIILDPPPEQEICVITLSGDEESGPSNPSAPVRNKGKKRKKWRKEQNQGVDNAVAVNVPFQDVQPATSECQIASQPLYHPLMGPVPKRQGVQMPYMPQPPYYPNLMNGPVIEGVYMPPCIPMGMPVCSLPPSMPVGERQLRPIVIDGSNVAREHGKAQNVFSCPGVKIAVDYFRKRGHKQITVFVPQFRRRRNSKDTIGQDILEKLALAQIVVFTPSRYVNGRSVASYDDRFIVRLAQEKGGVIVSNDNFRDLMKEKAEWKEVIEQRLLMYCFVGDLLMIPDDPMGRNGPSLDDYLSFP